MAHHTIPSPGLGRTHSRFLSRTGLASLAAISAAALLSGQHAQAISLNLITNGNFAVPGTAGQLTVNTSLAGWTGGGKEGFSGSQTTPPVFVFPSTSSPEPGDAFMGVVSFYGNPTSPSGNNFVALAADPIWGGSLTQTIDGLTVGNTYTLTFNWAGMQRQGAADVTMEDVQVTFGSSVQMTSVVTTLSQSFQGWQMATMNFTATAPSQALTFLGMSPPIGNQPWTALDDVLMTPDSVPEPGAFGLIGAAGLFVGGFRRYRKSAD